jgi:tetratricopeptide (TPR) repeat protein
MTQGESAEDRFEVLFRQLEADPEADRPAGCLHTAGHFLHLVRSPETGEFLAPTYSTLADQIKDAYARRAELARFLEEGGEETHSLRMLNFLPYPGPLSPVNHFRSNLVAIIDSGVLTEHPLLRDRIERAEDFTGEGVEDLCGHGTIQAIRQVWFEPYARLLILKAFAGPSGTPTPKSLARALRYLYRYEGEIGFVFIAGGVDVTRQPSARVICQLATEVVNKKELLGNFVATTGNAGNESKWCPAEAERVTGIAVVDHDTLQPGAGRQGGISIPQKGEYVSFPDIEPLRLGDFYYRYASLFREQNHFPLAHEYAAQALSYPYVEGPTLKLLSILASQEKEWEKAVELVNRRLEQSPDDPDLYGELATALMSLGRDEEAAEKFRRAVELKTRNADVWHNYAVLAERLGDREGAHASYVEAARLHPSYLFRLQTFGSRAFYEEDYEMAARVNETMLGLDPTFAAAYYNLSICHAMKGDTTGAENFLERYGQSAARLDTSFRQYAVEEVAWAFQQADPVIRATLLAYSLDEEREHAPQYALLADLCREDAGARGRRLEALSEAEMDRLVSGAVSCTRRLLSAGRAGQYGPLAEVLESMCGAPLAKQAERAARLRESLGRLRHRLGDFAGAVADFDSAASLWAQVKVRRKEAALVAKGFAQFALGEFAAARESFQGAASTSLNIKTTKEMQVVTTSLTPRLHLGRACLALRDGDLAGAREQVEAAHHGEADGFETLLLHMAVLGGEGRAEEMWAALRRLLRAAYRDEDSQRHFLRLLEDHPFYNFTLADGHTVLDYFWGERPGYLASEVSLVSQTRFPLEQLQDPATGEYGQVFEWCAEGPAADPAATTRVAVLGTGLMSDHPCLANYVAEAVDFTGEGPRDWNGSSTMQALYLLNSNRQTAQQTGQAPAAYSLYGVKVLDRDGRGSVQNLMAGLLWAHAAGAWMIMTHVQTNRKDWHLLGIVHRVSRHVIIVTTAPDEGGGRVFPSMVAGQVIIT